MLLQAAFADVAEEPMTKPGEGAGLHSCEHSVSYSGASAVLRCDVM